MNKPSETDALIPKETVEKLLSAALSGGGDFAEVYVQRSRHTLIPLEEKKVRRADLNAFFGAGIRVISGEKTGYAYSDNLDEKSLLEAARAASLIAESSSDRTVRVTPEKAPEYSKIVRNPAEAAPADKIALLKRANKAAFGYDPRIKQVDVKFVDEQKDILIANSDGLWVSDRQILLQLFVECMAKNKKASRDGHYGSGGRIGMEFFDTVSPEEIAQEAARIAVVQLDSVPAPAGCMPVVISKGWGGVLLHEAVGHGLEADFIRKGTSIYEGRLGEKVAGELCTLVDDATLPNNRGGFDIDDEGTPGQRTTLIEKGVLKSYLTDRLNAGLAGFPLTGNGRRQNYRHIPYPRMSCFMMEAGEADPDEIIKSIKRGVFAKGLGGGQVDITNGNFVFSITEGYLIENGKVTAPIQGATLIGNGPDILNKVTMLGSDLHINPGLGTCGKNGQGVPSTVGMPTVKVSELTVGGTSAGE